MSDRKQRLAKLVKVQRQLKALHETRHAGFLSEAAAAENEAVELVNRFDAKGSLSGMFPDVYHRRIGKAVARRQEQEELARTEAGKVAVATARTNMVERAYREVRQWDERQSADRDRLEIIERNAVADDR
ncbi:hypothetical protein C7441_10898 [Pseudaminobacter salicylatoxidans]|uniref:Flagellar FliJ protein n=1 Tax=Pseudaminobacter salicylatoxidans TaxID=93369 RepID=A0A316C408_PSESE|nr:hypothetical protein [Pseudaminobacter salicylatoxidans]PWJ83706.1 hypothetical protein C7441_10898 [Pseudaminobacter salicylatoxidans]